MSPHCFQLNSFLDKKSLIIFAEKKTIILKLATPPFYNEGFYGSCGLYQNHSAVTCSKTPHTGCLCSRDHDCYTSLSVFLLENHVCSVRLYIYITYKKILNIKISRTLNIKNKFRFLKLKLNILINKFIIIIQQFLAELER